MVSSKASVAVGVILTQFQDYNIVQAYVSSLQASLGSSTPPTPPSYHQLAAASRLATLLGSHHTTSPSPSPAMSQDNQARDTRKRPGNQFSIDELLRQDDKKGKFEADSKSVSVAEVDENEESQGDHGEEESHPVKLESECPAE